ncbi:MAG: hypothetical protein PUA50_07520 [Eubacteriales bacterium]|nr:hypothetical protein [Eubacteriales bacterium]
MKSVFTVLRRLFGKIAVTLSVGRYCRAEWCKGGNEKRLDSDRLIWYNHIVKIE